MNSQTITYVLNAHNVAVGCKLLGAALEARAFRRRPAGR
jgi:hypothetical protein